MDRATTGTHRMKPVRFWDTDRMLVEQDDEGHAVVRYCLDHDDRFFKPAWCYYPDWVLLAAIDTYRAVLGTTPDAAWEGCREVAMAAGPGGRFADVAVMTERPTLLGFNAAGQLHAEDEPTAVWPDCSQMCPRDGKAVSPR